MTLNEIRIEFNEDADFRTKVLKESNFYKSIYVVVVIGVILGVVTLGLLYSLDILMYGFRVYDLIMDIILPITFISSCYITTKIITKRILNRLVVHQKREDRKIAFLISDHGLNVNAFISDSILDWKYIRSFKNTELAYIISLVNKLTNYIIPKVSLTQSELDTLENIFERNLTEKQKKSMKNVKLKVEKLEKVGEKEQ